MGKNIDKDRQNKTVLFDALKNHLSNRVVRFDVPGHKGGRGNKEFRDFIGLEAMQMDVNSMKPLDNLCHPTSVIKEAQDIAAEAFGAKEAYFMVSGTTGAVQAMIMATCKAGDKIIIPRNVHRSAINAMVICGAIPIYINPGLNKKLGISLGMSINDVKKATEYINDNKLASVVEINISCPNAGKEPFIEAESLDALLTALDSVPRDVPFWVKMPHLYDVKQFDSLLKVIVRHNIQGVTVANLVKDRSKIDIKDPLTDEIRGGLSGEPTREHSLDLIRHAYKKYGDRLTIIGVGGVFSAEDAYAKIKAGASLVGLITGLFFEGPQLVGQINRGLVGLLKKDGFSHISEAVGADFRSEPKKAKKL